MADFLAEAASHLCFFRILFMQRQLFFIAMDCFRSLPIPPPSKKADPCFDRLYIIQRLSELCRLKLG